MYLNKENKKTKETEKHEKLQWHPAFRGALKTEFAKEQIPLEYREEHAVTKKELKTDIIVIQKNQKEKLKNPIGHIFRTFNIVEYKCPEDSLTVNDFYKVYAYTCILKSDTTETLLPTEENRKSISAEKLTITMAASRYPRNLIHHLVKERNYKVEKYDDGIYHIIGDFFPIQLLLIPKLNTKEHAWLKSLTRKIDKEILDSILSEYRPEEKNEHKDVVVDILLKANEEEVERWKEEHNMSGALLELMKPEMEAYAKEQAKEHDKEHAVNMLKQHIAIEMIEKCIPELSREEIEQIAETLKE